MESRLLMIEAKESLAVLSALASEPRLAILELLNNQKLNVNDIAKELHLPQSSVSTNIKILEEAGLITVEVAAGKKGAQKLCSLPYDEVVVQLPGIRKEVSQNIIEVVMPVGLYTDFEVHPPCGLCSREEIIGFLDVPESFLNPKRAVASLIWFERGFVEYKFPNNLKGNISLERLEVSMELSSEVPGTNSDWPSDITVWINGVEIGVWTCPGDFGDVRGKLTPMWWKLAGSQYGLLKNWNVTETGTFVDGIKVSDVTLAELNLRGHSSIKVRIGIQENAVNVGGLNIFGAGFGNYDQDIVLTMYIQ
ncbi:transcriptional regulatory protein [Candidatus Vecturithrix granuli]|uniref:Transcriptional regulatory protein n=1 Tax=Vecturithrix granuli TaxID=1499967 RepID=A0A081C6G6_VECG1|nr:transcriptional regulatory protein [Candidatus Vecturithrix granuli]